MNPLFIPLRGEYYDAFAAGTKTEEFRRAGRGWNATTCAIGRSVTLSRGYGKAHSQIGVITGFRIIADPDKLPGWVGCYGKNAGPCAAIRIKLI